jgi:maltooligosyltrehalose synthase
VAQQNTVASLAARVLQLNSDVTVLKQTVYLLKVLVGAQLFQGQMDQLEAFLRRFAEAERDFDPDRQTLDAMLQILRQNIPFSES